MKLTEKLTQQIYLDALSELEAVLRSRTASREQKRAALDAMDDLDRRFIRKTTDSLEARTEQFRKFTKAMAEVVAAIENAGSPFAALKRLKKLVNHANDILHNEDA
jgi:recombinational DNA repair ATPase RecF